MMGHERGRSDVGCTGAVDILNSMADNRFLCAVLVLSFVLCCCLLLLLLLL